MFCKKCGTENVEDALFCKNCGTPLNETAAPKAHQSQIAASMKYILTHIFHQPASTLTYAADSKHMPAGLIFFGIKAVLLGLITLLMTDVLSSLLSGQFSMLMYYTGYSNSFGIQVFFITLFASLFADAVMVFAFFGIMKLFKYQISLSSWLAVTGSISIFTSAAIIIVSILSVINGTIALIGLVGVSAAIMILQYMAVRNFTSDKEDKTLWVYVLCQLANIAVIMILMYIITQSYMGSFYQY